MLEMLVAALIWPAACNIIGDIYHDAARIRDQGLPLEVVVTKTENVRIKRALFHVYERPDMTPEQWRWFAAGVCVGGDGQPTLGRVM